MKTAQAAPKSIATLQLDASPQQSSPQLPQSRLSHIHPLRRLLKRGAWLDVGGE